VTLFQLDNYGPWTVTPEPRPEPRLQALQARLYADLADAVGDRDGYVFATRYDNVVAVTNGMDLQDHRAIQRAVDERYPVSATAAVGAGATPAAALAEATEGLQAAGSAQDPDRTGVLAGDPLADPGIVRIAHFDVVDATGRFTDRLDAYAAHLEVRRATQALSAYLYAHHGALSFFVGGDNVISVTPALDADGFEAAIDHVVEETGIAFQVGVGEGESAAEAGMAAKHALEDCRREGSRLAGLATPTAD